MKKWSRRGFLRAGVVSSIAMHGATATGLSFVHEAGESHSPPSITVALGARDRHLLRIAMDEIIPAGDGMPAASEAGGLEYLGELASRHKEVAEQLRESLGALEGSTRERFQSSFLSLSPERRIESLTVLEKENASAFKILHDLVYEAYYTRPTVWKLIGYEFHPTDESGPHMKPFDEAILAEVRKKPKYYREV